MAWPPERLLTLIFFSARQWQTVDHECRNECTFENELLKSLTFALISGENLPQMLMLIDTGSAQKVHFKPNL